MQTCTTLVILMVFAVWTAIGGSYSTKSKGVESVEITTLNRILTVFNASSMGMQQLSFVQLDITFNRMLFYKTTLFEHRTPISHLSTQNLSQIHQLFSLNHSQLTPYMTSTSLLSPITSPIIFPSQFPSHTLLDVFPNPSSGDIRILIPTSYLSVAHFSNDSIFTHFLTLTYNNSVQSFPQSIVDHSDREIEMNLVIEIKMGTEVETASVLWEERPGETGWQEGQVFAEMHAEIRQRHRETVGMGMMMKPAMSAVGKPVISGTTEFGKKDIMPVFEEEMFQTLTNKVSPDASPEISKQVEPMVAESLIQALPESISTALIISLTRSLGAYLSAVISQSVSPELSQFLSKHMIEVIPPMLGGEVSEELDRMALMTLVHSLTRSLTHSVTAALSSTIQLSKSPPDNEIPEMCRQCFRETMNQADNKECKRCPFSPENVYYKSYYAAYYSDFYSDYYAKYYADAVVAQDIATFGE